MSVMVYTKKSDTNQSIKYIDRNICNGQHEEKWQHQKAQIPIVLGYQSYNLQTL